MDSKRDGDTERNNIHSVKPLISKGQQYQLPFIPTLSISDLFNQFLALVFMDSKRNGDTESVKPQISKG
jgi:hypothetical protein